MDVIKFWQKQTDLWAKDKLCGKCWVFGAPLSQDGANKQQVEANEACCVHVILTDYRESSAYQRSSNTGYVNRRTIDYQMELHVVERDKLATNMYNEIIGHPISDSKWERILKPIRDCITPENTLKVCELMGIKAEITRWALSVKTEWLDNNYSGWRLVLTLTTIDEY